MYVWAMEQNWREWLWQAAGALGVVAVLLGAPDLVGWSVQLSLEALEMPARRG